MLAPFHQTPATREGKDHLDIATALDLIVLFYDALQFKMTYSDCGIAYYE